MDARIRAIKASATLTERAWGLSVSLGYLGRALASVGSQIAAERVANERMESYRAYAAGLSSNAPTNAMRRVRVA